MEPEEKSRDNGSCVPHAEHIFGMLINRVQRGRAQTPFFAMAVDEGADRGSGPRFVCYATDTGEMQMLVPILLVCGNLYSYIIPSFSVVTVEMRRIKYELLLRLTSIRLTEVEEADSAVHVALTMLHIGPRWRLISPFATKLTVHSNKPLTIIWWTFPNL